MDSAADYFGQGGSGLFFILASQLSSKEWTTSGSTSRSHKRRRKLTWPSAHAPLLQSSRQKSAKPIPSGTSHLMPGDNPLKEPLTAATAALQALQQTAQNVQKWAQSGLSHQLNRPTLAFASLSLNLRGGAKGGAASLPGPHEADLPRIFAELDVDKKGYLCTENLRVALSRVGLPCGHDYLESLMKQYDANHDGKVDLQEFQDYVAHRQRDMAKAFDALDLKDGKHLGRIDTDTLVHVLKKAGLSAASAEDAHHMISLLDKDHDGVISYDEFCRFACLLPAAQVSHNNTLTCWADSADWISHMEYRLSMVPPKSARDRLIAGGLAGAISRTCVAPFERLRTIMMTSSSISFPEAVSTMWADNGVFGLWKGNLLTVAKTIPASAIQFATYDGTKDFLLSTFPRQRSGNESLSQWEKMFAGGVAGASAILVTYPLETLRTRMSMAGGATSLPGCIQQIWQSRGPRGFYQGLKTGLFCEVLTTGLGFWAYELGQSIFREVHDGRSPSPRERGFIGGFSALVVMAATLPLDVIQRRLQAQGHPGRPVIFNNAVHAFTTILKTEGWRSFYRGMLVSFMKVGPSIGATYALYALLVQKWGIGGIRPYDHLTVQEEAAFANGSSKHVGEAA